MGKAWILCIILRIMIRDSSISYLLPNPPRPPLLLGPVLLALFLTRGTLGSIGTLRDDLGPDDLGHIGTLCRSLPLVFKYLCQDFLVFGDLCLDWDVPADLVRDQRIRNNYLHFVVVVDLEEGCSHFRHTW